MKRLLEVIVLFLISDIRIFIGENDSIQSTKDVSVKLSINSI